MRPGCSSLVGRGRVDISRRGFLGACLALGAAPMVVRASSLMKIIVPTTEEVFQIALAGPEAWRTVSEELSYITRRAFVPKMVTSIYKESPLMGLLLADEAADRILSL